MRAGVVVQSLVLAAATLTPLAARAEPPVYVIAPPPPLAAVPDPEAPPPPPDRSLRSGSVEVGLGSTFFAPNVSHLGFSGVGIPVGQSESVRFHQSGRQLGLGSPTLVGAELAVRYMQRYFAVGVVGFMAGNPGGSDITPVPPSSPGAKLVDPGALLAYGGGIDFAGALPAGPVAFRLGGITGIRGFSVPITGFKLTTCHGKSGTYPCNEVATTGAQMYLEPRLTVQVSPMREGFYFGGYVGAELANGFAPTGGVFIGFHTSHDALR